ncbi:MAG: hypothetical protein ACJ8HQ_04290 [Chthoniobacterales bacterium]
MKKLAVLLVLLVSPLSTQADLKSFFHGTQAAATPGPPDAKAASVSFAPDVAADSQVLEFTQAFAEAMRVHDGKSLKPRLSEKYTIENMPAGQDPTELLMQAMVRMKAPEEIVVTSIVREGGVRIATTEFRTPEKTKTRVFKFDPNGKLISADFFKLEMHGHGF